ncbi:hypothetical protein ED852_004952 [Escherichia coli]|nr:hypothetical protein [Escherichia coli]MDU9443329.1 hypothetical protein [Escherichia coli]
MSTRQQFRQHCDSVVLAAFIRFTGNDVFSCMPVTYSPYANDIFVWYVADTFQTIVTTWASD